jgi:hypothetical protein
MHRRRLRSPDDRQRNRVVGIATEAAHLEIGKAGVQGVTERRRRLRRPLVAEHAHVLGNARQLIGLLSRLCSAFGRHLYVVAVKGLAGFGAHRGRDQSVSALAGQAATAWG